MANTQKPDLRDGKPGADANTNAKLAGHADQIMPTAAQGRACRQSGRRQQGRRGRRPGHQVELA